MILIPKGLTNAQVPPASQSDFFRYQNKPRIFWSIIKCDYDHKRCHKFSRLLKGAKNSQSQFFSKRNNKIGHFFEYFPIIKCDFDPKRCHRCSNPPPSPESRFFSRLFFFWNAYRGRAPVAPTGPQSSSKGHIGAHSLKNLIFVHLAQRPHWGPYKG